MYSKRDCHSFLLLTPVGLAGYIIIVDYIDTVSETEKYTENTKRPKYWQILFTPFYSINELGFVWCERKTQRKEFLI